MSKFYIESKAGVIFGIYGGDTPAEAFEAMVADAGDGHDVDGRRSAGTPDDWTILEVVDVDQDWERGATLYTLENGGVLVDSGPYRDYYADMSAARAALGGEWSGHTDPEDPDNFWIDDATGQRVRAE